MVDEVDLLGNDVHCGDVVVLRQQSGDGKPDIAGACYCNIHEYCFFMASPRQSQVVVARGWFLVGCGFTQRCGFAKIVIV